MIHDWDRNSKYIDMINGHIQYIWSAIPSARPENMVNIKNTHDIWDWCDSSNLDFDIFEKSVTMYALEKISKISELDIKVSNGNYTIFSPREQISFSGANLLILLSEFIKISEMIKKIDTILVEKNYNISSRNIV